SALAETDPAYDLELDSRLAERARAGEVLLESRLAGWITAKEAVEATRVWVSCAEDERARRVAKREAKDVDAALAANRRREASELQRYREYYGIDLADLSVYDVVLDSTVASPDDLVAAVLDAVAKT